MNIRTCILIQIGILIASLAITAIYWQRLPEIVPTHWNLNGQVDQTGSKSQLLLLGPGLVLMILVMTLVLPKLSPKNFEIERFGGTFSYAMVLTSALMLFIGIIVLIMAEGSKIRFDRWMMSGLFLFFALLGNVLGKVRRNFFMGIRTPWTLASERVWDATHRSAARIWFVGGLIGTAACLLGLPMAGSIGFLLILSFWPVVQSYFLYQKLER